MVKKHLKKTSPPHWRKKTLFIPPPPFSHPPGCIKIKHVFCNSHFLDNPRIVSHCITRFYKVNILIQPTMYDENCNIKMLETALTSHPRSNYFFLYTILLQYKNVQFNIVLLYLQDIHEIKKWQVDISSL